MRAVNIGWAGLSLALLLGGAMATADRGTAPPQPPPQPLRERRYACTELRALPGHGFVQALALNDAGEVVGLSCEDYQTGCRAVSWRNGLPRALPSVPGAVGAGATDVNEAGAISGWYQVRDLAKGWLKTPRPLLWPRGRESAAPVRLPLPPGTEGGRASALNDAGLVVGTANRPVTVGKVAEAARAGIVSRPVLWEQGRATVLTAPGLGPFGEAEAVSGGGAVFGYTAFGVTSDTRKETAFRSYAGKTTFLAGPGVGGRTGVRVNAANREGAFAGSHDTEHGSWAFVARGEQWTDLPPPPGFISAQVLGMNDRGQMVGSVADAGGNKRGAALWEADRDGVYRVRLLAPDFRGKPLPLWRAVAINNRGEIVASASISRKYHSYLLRPK